MISLVFANQITEQKVKTLRGDFAIRVSDWIRTCLDEGLLPYVYEGFRTNERQQELYEQGRTKPGKIVTWARPGQSFHNYGLAVDWVPLELHKKAEGMYEAMWEAEHLYKKGQELASSFNMRPISKENPHLEDARFSSWKEIKKNITKD